jgi:hypothetical protein
MGLNNEALSQFVFISAAYQCRQDDTARHSQGGARPRNAGYDGYVSIEFEGPNDCIESIKKGIETLKSFGVEA